MYGSIETPKAADAADVHTFEWHQRGKWLQLLIAAVLPVMSQFAALSIITITVNPEVIPVLETKTVFMNCDSRIIGLPAAVMCECSKASLRCFPLLAIVISLTIAMRGLLRQRIYYEMLRHGHMLDFETVTPAKDPLFICIIVCLAIGSMHLVLIYNFYDFPKFLPFAKTTLMNYFAPAAAFLAFLASAYDTESQLVPLNKYMEEKPDVARATLATMPVLPENLVAAAVQQGLHIPKGRTACTCDECFTELVAVTGTSLEGNWWNLGNTALPSSAFKEHHAEHAAKFVAEMWPARILLDLRVQDAESRTFRSVWYVLSALVIPLAMIVAFFFSWQAWKDVQDVREGQYSDAGALAVELMYAGATGWLFGKLSDLMFIPFRTSSGE